MTAEDKRALAMFNCEEKAKREQKVMADLQRLVQRHIGQDAGLSHDPFGGRSTEGAEAWFEWMIVYLSHWTKLFSLGFIFLSFDYVCSDLKEKLTKFVPKLFTNADLVSNFYFWPIW